MLFFGKRAVQVADETAREAERIKRNNFRRFDEAESKAENLHDLLKANGVTLAIFYAAGGPRRRTHGSKV